MRSRNKKKYVSAIVVAAGASRRFKSGVKKQFYKIRGKEIFLYPLEVLIRSKHIGEIVVVLPGKSIKKFDRLYKYKKIVSVVAGGESRAESVRNGLAAISEHADYVFVQDGARPFLKECYIKDCLAALEKHDGAIVALKVSDTIKKAFPNGTVKATVSRSRLYRAQTPQAFRKEILVKAYSQKNIAPATDDSGLVEKILGRVKIIEGSDFNIKVTKNEDIKILGCLLKK